MLKYSFTMTDTDPVLYRLRRETAGIASGL